MLNKIASAILILLLPFISFAQWSQLGNDITGMEGDKLGTNNSISLAGSGQTLAVGSPFNDDNGAFSGFAKVYQFDGTAWNLKGDPIEGILPDTEGTGAAVSLSEDGNTLAVGSSHGLNSLGYRCGVVNVYDWDGTSWILRGATIEGEGSSSPAFATDVFGTALSLSADGNFIVVGARGNSPEVGVLQISGHARVYRWDGNEWLQMGTDIDGLVGLEAFGYSVSINEEANIIAIGGRSRSILLPDSSVVSDVGYVRIFDWDGTEWEQRGEPFFGTVLGEKLGSAVSLSADGNTIGMGAPAFGASIPGYAKVFDWDGTSWVQRGETISGGESSQAGSSIDLSADGNIIAVGEPWHNGVYGQVRVFEWINGSWEQIENEIDESGPPNSINSFGSAVSISTNGSKVAIGAFGFDLGSFTDEGQVTIFENQSFVSIDDLDASEISYYPNPISHSLFIRSSNNIENVEVFTMTGKRLNSVNVSSNEFDLNMSDLTAGSYFVKIQLRGKVQTIKIVKL